MAKIIKLKNNNDMAAVKVTTLSYKDFVERYQKVEIPDYQRPYRWNREKVNDLLSDLQEFFVDRQMAGLDYYMGGILLYDNKIKSCYEIIDGQQRLTTLNLMHYVLNNTLLPGQDLNYNNHLSFYHIKDNVALLQTKTPLLQQLQQRCFLEKIIFTLIEGNDEDQSFAFFDSQNNRGVSLAADDYLKAYHLREVDSEGLQSQLAEDWEKSAIKAQNEKNIERGLLHLLYKILYRSRAWQGQTQIIAENKDTILNIFQKKTRKTQRGAYRLFHGKDNIRFAEMNINKDEEIILVSVLPESNIIDEQLPFTLRQPIYKGLNFFQFTQKYHAIHQKLFYASHTDAPEINTMQHFYAEVYSLNMSEYLRHYMQLCLVMYYDGFGTLEIDKAIQYFDYFIGSIRIEKYYVRQEAVKNSLMVPSTQNILDVLASAYLPDEVFDFITSQDWVKQVYEKENLKPDNGVRDQYKQRVLKFYDRQEGKLNNRLEWIK